MISDFIKRAVLSKMIAEGAVDVTDEEIHRTLSGCVMPDKMKLWAKDLRESGSITVSSLQVR